MASKNTVASSWEELQRKIREVAELQLHEQMELVANFLDQNAAPCGFSENNDLKGGVKVMEELQIGRGKGEADMLLPAPQPHVLMSEIKHATQEATQFNKVEGLGSTESLTRLPSRPSRPSPPSRSSRMSLRAETIEAAQLDLSNTLAQNLQTRRSAASFDSIEAAKTIPFIGENMVAPLLTWWLLLEEPKRTGILADVLSSSFFSILTSLVILCNLVLVIIMTDRIGANPMHADTQELVDIENGLLVWYTVELALKLFVHRLYFFVNQDGLWNLADLLIVVVSYTPFFLQSSLLRSFRFARFARFIRFARTLRLLRVFEDLRKLLDSLFACMITMTWSLVLVTFLLCLFSIFFVQMQADHAQYLLLNNSTGGQFLEDFESYFNSVPRSMLTLFATTTGGEDWLPVHGIISEAGDGCSALYVFFIVFFILAVYNIVMSTFIDRAVKACLPSVEEKMKLQLAEDKIFALALFELVDGVDSEDKGNLDFNEFKRGFVAEGTLCQFLRLHGLDIRDPKLFFDMVCESKGREAEMTVVDFVEACVRLQSQASALDVAMIGYELKKLRKQLRGMNSTIPSKQSVATETNQAHSMTLALALTRQVHCFEEPVGKYRNGLQEPDSEVPAKKATKGRKPKRGPGPKQDKHELQVVQCLEEPVGTYQGVFQEPDTEASAKNTAAARKAKRKKHQIRELR